MITKSISPRLATSSIIVTGAALFLGDVAARSVFATEPKADAQPAIHLISETGIDGLSKLDKNVTLCEDVQLHDNSSDLVSVPGKGVVAVLTKLPFGEVDPVLSKQEFGDCKVQLEFLIARGSNSGVKMQQRYEIQLFDSHGTKEPTAMDCGGIYPHWIFRRGGQGIEYTDDGVPPATNAALPAGEWQRLEIIFRAPKFDVAGNKVANAKFESVILNGLEIHRDVEVHSPTGNRDSPLPEVAKSALLLQIDHGAIAFRNLCVTSLN